MDSGPERKWVDLPGMDSVEKEGGSLSDLLEAASEEVEGSTFTLFYLHKQCSFSRDWATYFFYPGYLLLRVKVARKLSF